VSRARHQFVPWLSDLAALQRASPVIDWRVLQLLCPRLGAAPAPVLLQSARVYVDVDEEAAFRQLNGCIPVMSVEAASSGRLMRDTPTRVGVRVEAQDFEDDVALARRLAEVRAAVPFTTAVSLFVDVLCQHAGTITETIATGAARRVPHRSMWSDVTVCFDRGLASVAALGELQRPRYSHWTAQVDAPVAWGERPVLPAGCYAYPAADRWLVATSDGGSGASFAEMITARRGFAGPSCCAGDRWMLAAAHEETDANDLEAWHQAALVHWLSSSVGSATHDAELAARTRSERPAFR
jgi:hypothetical protein